MRVVAGRLKGRKLGAPEGRDIRPTADKARQAIFNIIEHGTLTDHALEGARVIDVFAGTGALGIEALSRGAAHGTFIEHNRAALAALEANLKACGLGPSEARVLRSEAANLAHATTPADFAFLDPPYGEDLAAPALQTLGTRGWLKDGALCVLELGRQDDFTPPAGFVVLDERRYGAAHIVFLRFHKGS